MEHILDPTLLGKGSTVSCPHSKFCCFFPFKSFHWSWQAMYTTITSPTPNTYLNSNSNSNSSSASSDTLPHQECIPDSTNLCL